MGSILTLWLEDKIICPDYQQGAQDTPGNELPGLILGAMSIYIILGLCAIYFQNLKVGLKSLLEIQEKKRNMTFRERKVCSSFVPLLSFFKGKATHDLAPPQQ